MLRMTKIQSAIQREYIEGKSFRQIGKDFGFSTPTIIYHYNKIPKSELYQKSFEDTCMLAFPNHPEWRWGDKEDLAIYVKVSEIRQWYYRDWSGSSIHAWLITHKVPCVQSGKGFSKKVSLVQFCEKMHELYKNREVIF